MRKQCIYGMIDGRHEMEFDTAAHQQINLYKLAAMIEIFLMDDENGWGEPGQETWYAAKRFTSRNSKNKDFKIWKLLDEQEQSLCNEFLDMWGTWRENNSTVTYLRITRDGYTHKADYKYTKHDINDYVQRWDDENNAFRQLRIWMLLSADEELREEVIPYQLEPVTKLIECFRQDALVRLPPEHCRQPCNIFIQDHKKLSEEEHCKETRKSSNSRTFLEELLKNCNMTLYYKTRPSLIDDYPVYKEVWTEMESCLEEKDNEIDTKLDAHILGQRWIMHEGFLMWMFDTDVFEKMKQPCLLDPATGRFRGIPQGAVEEEIQGWNMLWGDGVGMTMEDLEDCQPSYQGTPTWHFIFTSYKENQNICVDEEFMSTDTDLYPPTLLKVGMQGVILAVNYEKNLLVYFIGDTENRWIAIDNYPNISLMPNIHICINEDFMSTATDLYNSLPHRPCLPFGQNPKPQP